MKELIGWILVILIMATIGFVIGALEELTIAYPVLGGALFGAFVMWLYKTKAL